MFMIGAKNPKFSTETTSFSDSCFCKNFMMRMVEKDNLIALLSDTQPRVKNKKADKSSKRSCQSKLEFSEMKAIDEKTVN